MFKQTARVLILCSVVFVIAGASPVERPVVVGHVLSDGVSVGGVEVPRGTTLFSDSLVSTTGDPGAVFLKGRGVVSLAKNSSVQIESPGNGELDLNVRFGELTSYDSARGAVSTASAETLSFRLVKNRRSTVWDSSARDSSFQSIDKTPRQRWAVRLGTVLASLDIPGVDLGNPPAGSSAAGGGDGDSDSSDFDSDDDSVPVTPDDEGGDDDDDDDSSS